MEVVPYHEESGAPWSAGEPLSPEIGASFISEDDDVPPNADKEYRYAISVWLENLEDATEDIPEIPPVYVVKFPDLVEKAWGWLRLIPYIPGCVDWNSYKLYLEEYSRKNDGEVAALCANNKPDKDKSYFVRAARCAYQRPGPDGHTIAYDCNALHADCAARLCITIEQEFRWCFQNSLTPEEINLSFKIEEFANRLIESASESSATAAAGLVCIAKETELLFELMDERQIDTSEMIALSKKVRQSALNLLLHLGHESSSAIGAMVGMAKEAKFVRYVLSRVDHYVELDFGLCGLIRAYTEKVLAKILQEFACEHPSNVDGNDAAANTKSEKHIGISTANYLNRKESGSVQDYKIDMNEYCGKDSKNMLHFTMSKDEELERKASADI